MTIENDQEVTTKGLPRRVVVKSAAWSVPVFASVGVTPAFAATGGTPVPIIASSGMTGSRGSGGTKEQVTFTWNIQVNATITAVTVQYGTVTNHTVTNATTTFDGATGAKSLSFRVNRQTGNNDTVPGFTITILFTHNGGPKTATFGVGALLVPEDTTQTFTVTPESANPTFTP